jgi:hypothetical protein
MVRFRDAPTRRKQTMESHIVTVPRPTTTPSNLLRRWLCPGSARMEAGKPDDDSNDARVGRLFHRYWGNPNLNRAFLTDDERDLLELSDRLLQDVLNELAFEIGELCHVEQTFSTIDGKLTGTPDRVHVWQHRKTALVVDLKSGFAVVERAELNLQLRGYAVLVHDAIVDELDHVYVAVLQPRLWAPSERISLAHYTRSDIALAREQVYGIISRSESSDATLRAGEEQCRYCRAKLTCPAFREALTFPIVKFETEADLTKAAREAMIEERLKHCSDVQLEDVLLACKLADFIQFAARDEARTRIEAGRFTNFVLGKASEVREITNVRRAIAMLALGRIATREEILDICEIPLNKLEAAYRKRNGGTWQHARDKINKVLNSVIAREPRKPRILRK